MKKLLALAAAGTALAAMPAHAQDATGQVNMTGVVGQKCVVLSEGGVTSSFTRTIDFGELSDTDGTLRTGLSGEFNGEAFAAKIVCTSGNPYVTVTATALATTNPALAGYDNSIDYNATIVFYRPNGTTTFNPASDGTPVSASLGGPLANTADNTRITATNFRTNNATDLLVAGSYSGAINITVAPTV